jgi:predicted exporter
MFDRYFSLVHDVLKRRRKLVLWSVVLLSLAASAAAFFVRYDSSMDLIFPQDRDIRRSIDFLRDSNLSDKIVVSVALTDPAKGKAELFEAVDRLAGLLTPPLFTRVNTGIPAPSLAGDLSILKFAPQMFREQDLLRIEKRLTREGVSLQLRSIYLGAMKLESIFTNSLVRSDPVGVRQLVFEKLQALPASMGYDVAVEDGHFISRDGRSAMIIVETGVKITDSREAKVLVETLQEHIDGLPGFVKADIISGHVHTVSNEKVIKRDITIASTLATISFLLLFLVVFPDQRIILVFLIPVVAIALSIVIATFFMGSLSYLVIGIGTAVAGITVDHGLHMYIALRKNPTAQQASNVARLITIDAVTTVFGFSTLFLSRVQGYQQLAFFAILCVGFSLLLSLFILPLTLSWNKPLPSAARWDERNAFTPRRLNLVVWAVLTAGALLVSLNMKFESDVMHLDGSEPEVRRAEERFYKTWGGQSNQAVFVVTGSTLEEALEANDRAYGDAAQAVGEKNLTSLALLWPSEKTRKENVDRWNRFWREGRADNLRRLIREEAPQYRMREQAFAPFFEGLDRQAVEAEGAESFLERIRERFIVKKKDGYQVLSFFPDDQALIDALLPVSEGHAGSFIVSRKAVSRSVSAFSFREVKFLVPVAFFLNVALTWLFFKNVKEMIIALTPLLTGIIWLLSFMALFGIPLDVVSIISLVVVSGVIVDYGIGVTYEYQYNLKIGTLIAVSLSAITTVLGSGVLLFAQHPVLFSIGVAMTSSVFIGYLTAILVVPPLCDLLVRNRRRQAAI